MKDKNVQSCKGMRQHLIVIIGSGVSKLIRRRLLASHKFCSNTEAETSHHGWQRTAV